MKMPHWTIFTTFLLSACASNGYSDFYHPNPNLTPEIVTERRILAQTDNPDLIHGSDPKSDVASMLSDGYMVVGTASFTGARATDQGAIAQAKIVGADKVLVYSNYIGSISTIMPVSTPTMQTSTANFSGNIYSPNGTSTLYGNGTVTSYGTQTTNIPINIQRYNFLAVYLVKLKFAFGALYHNLSTEEAKSVGSVNGVSVVNVVSGTPAASAGILPNDIILRINDVGVVNEKQMTEEIKKLQGKNVTVSIYRAGQKLLKKVSILTYNS